MHAPARLLATPLAYAAATGTVATVVLAIATVLAFVAWQQDVARIERLRGAERALASYGTSLLGAESALRRYLVTGRSDARSAYDAAAARAGDARGRVETLLADDTGTRAPLAETLRAVERAGAEWRRLIIVRDAQGPAAASAELQVEPRTGDVGAVLDPLGERVLASVAEAEGAARRMRMAFVAAAALFALAAAFAIVALTLVALRERQIRLETESAIERETQHDRHTRFPNRRFFTEWAGYALAGSRRDGDGLGLLLIGIEAGHVRLRHGALAREIGRRLRELKRESDFLGHVDENVFALAALHVDEAHYLAGLAQRILRALSHPPLPGTSLASIRPCVGVAMFPDDANDLPGLFAAADSALSAARHAGGNVVMFHGSTQPGVPAPSR